MECRMGRVGGYFGGFGGNNFLYYIWVFSSQCLKQPH